MRYLGVDLHANNFMVCFLSADGEQTFKRFKLSDIEAFKQCLAADDRIAVEATMTTRFFYTQVAPFVAECIVVNPSQFEVIKQSVKKTDQNDARSLAQFLSKGLLPSSRMKEELQAQIASLAQTRAKLVHLRTALLNKIHALVKSHGRESRKAAYDHEANLRKLLQLEWTVTERIELEVIAQQIRSLTDGIKRVGATDHEIKRRTRKGIETSRASKALALTRLPRRLSVIGDVNDFPDEDKLASYFGIVPPREANSNQTQHHGSITKRGSKLGRTVLVQCTLIAVRFSPYLKQYYERIKGRRGSGKAIIATARKFLGIIYRTLKHGWVFADFPNFVLAEQ